MTQTSHKDIHTSSFKPRFHHSLQILNNQSRSTATTVADASNTNLALLLPQDRGESGDNTSTRSAQRMADSNGATKDIDLFGVKTKKLDVGEGNNGESLVDLIVVDIISSNASMLDSLGDSKRRGNGEAGRVASGIAPTKDLGKGLDAELLELALRDKHNSGSAVVDGSSVGGGDSAAVGNKDRANSLELLNVEVLDLLVTVNLDGGLATAAGDLDRGDLGEETGLGGGLGLLVRLDGVLVLGLAGEVVFLAAELALHAHELLLAVGVAEAVLLYAVDEAGVAVLGAGA